MACMRFGKLVESNRQGRLRALSGQSGCAQPIESTL